MGQGILDVNIFVMSNLTAEKIFTSKICISDFQRITFVTFIRNFNQVIILKFN